MAGGRIPATLEYVFCSRDYGESEETDRFLDQVSGYQVPLITRSFDRFRAQHADKGAVSVRFAYGEVRTRHHGLFGTGDPKPGPGSEVTIPAEDPTVHKTDYVALFGAIAQILASVLTIAVVATKL